MLAHYQRCDLAILSISGQLMQGATMACGLTKRTTGNIVSGHTILGVPRGKENTLNQSARKATGSNHFMFISEDTLTA